MAKSAPAPSLPKPVKGSPSITATLIALLVVTLLGIGAGGAASFLALPLLKPSENLHKAETEAAAHGKYVAPTTLRELPPIVANLAAPAEVWIRLEGSLVLDPEGLPQAEVTVREVAADTLAYLRTLSLPELQGAAGLANLRQDLAERASIRSNGKVKEFIIHTLVVQ